MTANGTILPGSERRVCVIDADSAVRDGLATLIELSGHAVDCFADAQSFLESLDRNLPKCVLCEARLPDRDGFEVHRLLGGPHGNVPFALLVSVPSAAVYQRAQRAGIARVYLKPITDTFDLLEFVRGRPLVLR